MKLGDRPFLGCMKIVVPLAFTIAFAAGAQSGGQRIPPSALSGQAVNAVSAAPASESKVNQPSSVVWEREPDSFLGMKLGEKFALAECPIRDTGTTNYPILTLDFGAIRGLSGICFDSVDKVVRGVGVEKAQSFRIWNAPKIGIAYSVSVDLNADRTYKRFTLKLKQDAFETLFGVFKERYGTPTSIETRVVKTAAGGTFDSRTVTWRGNALSIFMFERSGNIDESRVLIAGTKALEQEAEAAKSLRATESSKF